MPSATGEGAAIGATDGPRGTVDVEDAAAALVTFASGAYGVLETSRVAIGRRVSLRLDVFGSLGSAAWDLEQPDEFRVCLPGDPTTFGYRRVLVNATHPGRDGAAGRWDRRDRDRLAGPRLRDVGRVPHGDRRGARRPR